MRKNDLIKLLQELPGNPELKLWNGYVSDFMDIGGLAERQLTKQTWEHYIEMCRLERCRDLQDWSFQFTEEDLAEYRTAYTKHTEWENDPYVYLDDIATKRYKAKRIVYIEAKLRGKQYADRLGSVSY